MFNSKSFNAKWALTSLCLVLPLCMKAREVKTASPNGKLVVTINDNGGAATYSVTLDDVPVVLPSRLGFKADFGDFTQGLSITDQGAGTGTTKGTYLMRQVKQSCISYNATTQIVPFRNAQGQLMQVEFFVKDNDLAFRYLIPRQKNDNPKCAVSDFLPPARRHHDLYLSADRPDEGMGAHEAELRGRLCARRSYGQTLGIRTGIHVPLPFPLEERLDAHLRDRC